MLYHLPLPTSHAEERLRPDRRPPASANEIRLRVRRSLAPKGR